MAISFMNIRTGERRELEDPHQIAAFLNSSDLHVNSNLGQDFGWRLAPSLVHRIDRMRADSQKLDEISRRTGIAIEELTTVHLVNEVSREDGLAARTAVVSGNDEPAFKSEYEAELNEMREKEAAKQAAAKKRAEAKKAEEKADKAPKTTEKTEKK